VVGGFSPRFVTKIERLRVNATLVPERSQDAALERLEGDGEMRAQVMHFRRIVPFFATQNLHMDDGRIGRVDVVKLDPGDATSRPADLPVLDALERRLLG